MTKEERDLILNKSSKRQRCEVWTRVMGYHRPVSEFNPGKKSEHFERIHFIEPGQQVLAQGACNVGACR